MMVGLHEVAFGEGARHRILARNNIARITCLSTAVVGRLLDTPGPPLSRLSGADARALEPGRSPLPAGDELSAITLPLTLLHCAHSALPGLHSLLSIGRDTRERAVILGRLAGPYGARMSVVSARDDDLFFDWIGYGIRWSGPDIVGARALDLPDPAIARVAAERYWTALRSGDPVFQYVRTPLGLEFVALTIATDPATRRGLVTISAPGRSAVAADGAANQNRPDRSAHR